MTAYDRALKLLSEREHTAREMKDKLQARGYTTQEIEVALGMLISEGSLSDERFASEYVRSRLIRNPEGKSVLMVRLREKGCSKELSEEVVNEAWKRGDYEKPLEDVIKKLIVKKGERKVIETMLRKGFTMTEIKSAIEALREEGEGEGA